MLSVTRTHTHFIYILSLAFACSFDGDSGHSSNPHSLTCFPGLAGQQLRNYLFIRILVVAMASVEEMRAEVMSKAGSNFSFLMCNNDVPIEQPLNLVRGKGPGSASAGRGVHGDREDLGGSVSACHGWQYDGDVHTFEA